MTTWDDLNARARGLGTHLLGRATLETLARAPDLGALAEDLRRRGYPIEEAAAYSPAGLELAARRTVAARFRILGRWAAGRSELLSVLFEDEDRRSIAALMRGAAQHAAPELRLSGLLPTPALPERALEELARQPSPGPVAALLSSWRHPLAEGLVAVTASPEPDLLRIELAVSTAFARRARANARKTGRGGVLLQHVQRVIDVENAYAALALTAEQELHAEDFWLPGGRGVLLALFTRAVATRDALQAGKVLAGGFAGSRIEAVFADLENSPGGVERGVLAAWIADLSASARTAPLSVAPLLVYALRLRAEALDIRWLVWGISLGAPSAALLEGLVTGS
jgi:vacuolar-type H+-ATPase subunit C/Vma6